MSNMYLSLIDMNDSEMQLFLTYLEKSKNMDCLQYLEAEFGDNLKTFLDLFAGETIKIPSKTELLNIANYSIIYNYMKDRNFTREAYQNASHLFKRRIAAIERIVEKVESVMEGKSDE